MMVPGKLGPQLLSFTVPNNGLQAMIGAVSESPYPSTTLARVRASNSSRTSSGSGAPPDIQARTAERSGISSSGSAFRAT